MSPPWILAAAALVAVVGLGTGAVWMNGRPSHAADTIVRVDADQFDPAEITVASGASITWQNTDQSGVHTAKADDGSFDTGYIDPGGTSESIVFSKSGNFPYTCKLHPYKKGTVTVQ